MECSSRRQFLKASSAAVTGVTAAAGLGSESRFTEARAGGSLLHSGVLRSECRLFAVFLLLHPQQRTVTGGCPDGEF